MASDDTTNTPQTPKEKGSAALKNTPVVENDHGTSVKPEAVASVWNQLLARSQTKQNNPHTESAGSPQQKTTPAPGVSATLPKPPVPAEHAQTAPPLPRAVRLVPGMPGYTPQGASAPSAQPAGDALPKNRPSLLARIRTYKSDVAALMKGNKTSLTDIALAGAEERRETEQVKAAAQAPAVKTKQRKHTLRVVIIVLLLSAAAAALAFVFFIAPRNKPAVVNTIAVTPLIFSDKQREIDLTRTGRATALAALTQEVDRVALPLGSLAHLYLTEGVGLEKKLISTERFFEILEARPPATLVRALKPDFMFGGHVFDGNQPFLIFKTTFFENAFAGMLKWEDDMAFDIGPLFVHKKQSLARTPDGKTATQTPTRAAREAVPLADQHFEDAVVENKDARVVRDGSGKIIFLYTFADRDTLIMTTNESTLKEIIFRMTTLRFVR